MSTLREPYRVEGKRRCLRALRAVRASCRGYHHPPAGGTGSSACGKRFRRGALDGRTGGRETEVVSCKQRVRAVVKASWRARRRQCRGPRRTRPLMVCAFPRRSAVSFACGLARDAWYRGDRVGETIATATRALARRSGIDVCPEGGAAWPRWRAPSERLFRRRDRVSFYTGTGLNTAEEKRAVGAARASEPVALLARIGSSRSGRDRQELRARQSLDSQYCAAKLALVKIGRFPSGVDRLARDRGLQQPLPSDGHAHQAR